MKQIALALALILVVGACGDDPAADTTATTAPPTTSTTAPTTITTVPPTTPTTTPPSTLPPTTATTAAATTTAAPATTTTTVAGSPFTTASYGFFPDPLGSASDGHGSGCAPGSGPLPDGMWFGFVEGIGGGAVTFDLACFFTGAAGWAAAQADGEMGYDLDFYIRNQSGTTRSVPLDSAGTAYWLDATGDLTPLAIPMADWPKPWPPDYQICPADFCSVWLFVNGGEATELLEQYLP